MKIPTNPDNQGMSQLKNFAGGSSLLLTAMNKTIKRLDTSSFDSQQFLAQLREDLENVTPQVAERGLTFESGFRKIAKSLLLGMEKAVSDLEIE